MGLTCGSDAFKTAELIWKDVLFCNQEVEEAGEAAASLMVFDVDVGIGGSMWGGLPTTE